MRVSTAKKILNMWVKDTSYPPLILCGHKGIGKTQSVKDLAKEEGMHLEILRLGSLNSPGDLLGFPMVEKNVDGKPIMQFSGVDRYERLKDGGILFLDELNRTKPVLLDFIMQALDEKRLDTYNLSNCSIVGSINPDTEGYNVQELEEAIVDRCLFVPVSNSIEDTVAYLKAHDVDDRTIEIALLGSQYLNKDKETPLPNKDMTSRGITQLNTILPVIDRISDDEDAVMELVRACIGNNGVVTWANRYILKDIPSAEEYLATPKAYKVSLMDMINKRILINRLDAYLVDHKPDRDFTKNICAFDKLGITYSLRTCPNIKKHLKENGHFDKTFQTIASDIIDLIK